MAVSELKVCLQDGRASQGHIIMLWSMLSTHSAQILLLISAGSSRRLRWSIMIRLCDQDLTVSVHIQSVAITMKVLSAEGDRGPPNRVMQSPTQRPARLIDDAEYLKILLFNTNGSDCTSYLKHTSWQTTTVTRL